MDRRGIDEATTMRPIGNADAESWVLTTPEGRGLLAEVAKVPAPGPADLERWRRIADADRVAAALRLAASRARGAAKFSKAAEMWLDPVGLEQATPEVVARHKARRFAGADVVDLCCGIGGDAVALAAESGVLAVDSDQGMCRRVRWNAEVYGVGSRVVALRSRAETFRLPPSALLHIDPDRRTGASGRARLLRDYVPGPAFLRSLPEHLRGGAIKLGPASDFASHFGAPEFEMEIISLGGECKEATAWFGTLATCRRRATVLPANATWSDRDAPMDHAAPIAPIGAWVYDPDPALVRADLLDSFAVAHGIDRSVAGLAFLTSQDRVASPFLDAFEVVEALPFDIKSIQRILSREEVGILDIKPKGLDLRPETLRTRFRLEGPNSATLLLMGGAGHARAVLARRAPTTLLP